MSLRGVAATGTARQKGKRLKRSKYFQRLPVCRNEEVGPFAQPLRDVIAECEYCRIPA
jgi:hypothetical protein